MKQKKNVITDLEGVFAKMLGTLLPTEIFQSKELDVKNSPHRIAKMWSKELLWGYSKEAGLEIKNGFTTFDVDEEHREMVVLDSIPYQSMCSHHLMPFFGVCHVGYLPNKKIVGLSKIPRVVNFYARRLQVQEKLVGQIADHLYKALEPQCVIVMLSGKHLCMEYRGVRAHGVNTTTTAIRGEIADHLKQEFFETIRLSKGLLQP